MEDVEIKDVINDIEKHNKLSLNEKRVIKLLLKDYKCHVFFNLSNTDIQNLINKLNKVGLKACYVNCTSPLGLTGNTKELTINQSVVIDYLRPKTINNIINHKP